MERPVRYNRDRLKVWTPVERAEVPNGPRPRYPTWSTEVGESRVSSHDQTERTIEFKLVEEFSFRPFLLRVSGSGSVPPSVDRGLATVT